MNTSDNPKISWIFTKDGSVWHYMQVNLSDYENIDNIDLSGIIIDPRDFQNYQNKKKSKRK